ncbi:hypothetical protein OH76DRAFT_1490184 [Lentinus brumalis]|uniref:DUF6533 domain-containing protein n=1 Tax=Lentinus brumalis TaxID=2498619 RepID=A0A371CJU0_9APHY|nr:hypothetical protein OH76DRAFT_1490184 [Polyporus brumalis]
MPTGTDDSGAAATVTMFSTIYINEYCATAASVLFIYDALTTFDREVARFWTAKRTGATFLFFANKYISVVAYVMALVEFAYFPSDKSSENCGVTNTDMCSCTVFQNASTAVDVLQFVPGVVFSALRGYVLSRSKVLGTFIFALSLAPVGVNLVPYGYQLLGVNLPRPFGCLATNTTTEAIVIVIARVPLVVADILLVYITWTKLNGRDTARDIRPSRRLSLSDILLRDGMIYFVVLSILNVLHLVLSLTAVVSNNAISYVTIFTTPLTVITISRFLLDLQEANHAVVRIDADDPLYSSRDPYGTPSLISSLGGFINPDVPVPSDDEFEWDGGSRSGREAEEREAQIAVSPSPSA